MPALLGWDIGPQQIDQPIARDRARSSLEMQVQQDGQMFLGAEADGRAAAANELGGSENRQLKLSDHCTPSHAPKRFRNSAFRPCCGRGATLSFVQGTAGRALSLEALLSVA